MPMMDINTVSAGGGTIADGRPLRRARSRPAKRGRGAGAGLLRPRRQEPTITDCNLVLGYLGEDNFLGGRMRLDAAKARAAIETRWRGRSAWACADAAEGIIRIIDVKMEEAIKAISTMRGHDLRDFMLLAFGGAGPLHAGRIAARPRHGRRRRAALSRRVFGDRPADVGRQARLHPVAHDAAAPSSRRDDVERHVRAARGAGARRNCAPTDSRRTASASSARSTCAMPARATRSRCPAPPTAAGRRSCALRATFDRQHQAMFGHMAPEEPVEIVSYRVRGIGLVPPVEMPRFKPTGTTLADALRETRRVRVRRRGARLPGLSARAARRRADGRRAGDPRPVRLHDRDLPRPGRARRRMEEPDRDAGECAARPLPRREFRDTTIASSGERRVRGQ